MPSRKKDIIKHATTVAARESLQGISIGSLAKDLRISKSGLLSHFGSKQKLQLEILDFSAEVFEAFAIRPALKMPRGEPRLRALFENWLRWFSQNPFGCGCIFSAAASELDDHEGPLRDRLVQHEKDFCDLVANVVRIGVQEGHFGDTPDAEHVAFMLRGILLAFHHSDRLLEKKAAKRWAQNSFELILNTLQEPKNP